MVETVGFLAAVIMPLFNIPLVMRMVKRKSSKDISLLWASGVWVCILGLVPAGWVSTDPILKIFTLVNMTLFSGVLACVIWFRVREKTMEPRMPPSD